MKELEVLINKRWVLKSEDKDLYYRIRDGIGEIRKFAAEKLGCQVIENSLLVKLEKIPAIPESFMGIAEFTSIQEYAFLCILLMFLEDKDAQEQFILSQLTEYVMANMPGEPLDWTLYTCRRRLVKVLRFAAAQGIIRVTDGTEEVFMDEESGEVLYENTGASRYFMRNFSRDIMGYIRPEDFRESEWYEVDEERGIVRRHRVYNRLLFSVGMYKGIGLEEDFEYLKYYGRRLAEDLEQNFSCRLDIHKGSAFLIMGDDCYMGTAFPGNNALSDIMLLCCARIREKVENKDWEIQSDETIRAGMMEFERMLKDIKAQYGLGFTKYYREMPEGEFVREVQEALEHWTFIRQEEKDYQVIICPSAGKITGRYPKEYQGGSENEQ